MRKNKAGSIQSVVSECFAAGGGLENVSGDVGLALSTLSYATEVKETRPGGLGVNYLDRLSRMNPDVAAVLARHFAGLAGGQFSSLGTDQEDIGLGGHLRSIIKEVSEGERHLVDLIEGGCPHVARKELEEARDAIDACVRSINVATRLRAAE